MKLQGTSVSKFSNFIENLKEIAGTKTLTRAEYDNNPNKMNSYSHINKNFGYTWNELLEQAGIPIKHAVSFPIKQGRKPARKVNNRVVECLRCGKLFESIDPKINRICRKCKNLEGIEDT